MGLHRLEAALRHDLEILGYPARPWRPRRTTPQGRPVLDVVIIGGGQSGLGVAFGLLREKVDQVLVIEQNPPHRVGPWRSFARMPTLRTPKHLVGIEYGLPRLSIRAWFEAQHGSAAWDAVRFIPTDAWADYLAWYRDVLQIPVRYETTAGPIGWDATVDAFAVPLHGVSPAENDRHGPRDRHDPHDPHDPRDPHSAEQVLLARKVVLATGIEGSGQWAVPPMLRTLPNRYYAHTCEPIDFAALEGQRVAVLGAGASAFDNAAMALEHGAREVRLFFRRARLPDVNPYRWTEFVGFLKHHSDLPDAQKWRTIRQIIRMGQLPPADTLARAQRFSNFHMHPASPWESIEDTGQGVQVCTPQGSYTFDFVIAGTGFVTDLSLRPELSALHPDIALWSDRYTPPAGEEHSDLLRHPYLGPYFELQEKMPGQAPYLHGIFNYTFGCLLSHGFGGASISGMKYSLPKVVYGVTRQLYLDDAEHYYASLASYDEKEFNVAMTKRNST